jgi:hypothetical protein
MISAGTPRLTGIYQRFDEFLALEDSITLHPHRPVQSSG